MAATAEIVGSISLAEHAASLYPESRKTFFRNVPLAHLTTARQVREGANPRQQDLDDSVREMEEFINPVNVACVTRETLEEYLEFANQTWGGHQSVEDCTPIPEDDGLYFLVLAGHSRLASAKRIAKESNVPEEEYAVKVQIHNVVTIGEFLAIQVHENIHASPSSERTAKALAEAFIYAQKSAAEHQTAPPSREAFASQLSITPGVLRNALAYVELPEKIRALSEDGRLPFSLAAELGKIVPKFREQMEQMIKNTTPAEQRMLGRAPDVDRLVYLELLSWIAMYNNCGCKLAPVFTRLKEWRLQHAHILRADEDIWQQITLAPEMPEDHERYLMNKVSKLLAEVKSTQSEKIRTLLTSATQLFNEVGGDIQTDNDEVLSIEEPSLYEKVVIHIAEVLATMETRQQAAA